jgi:type II secretory pathway pseudopilin PulG
MNFFDKKKYQLKKKQTLKGFTLIEILIYMALFVGFLLLLSALFISILDTQLNSSISSQMDQDTWYLINRLQYDMYRADSIELPVNNGDEGDTLVINVAGSTISYSLNNDQLIITENGQSYSLINQDSRVFNLNFKKLGNLDGESTISVYLELKNFASAKTKILNFTSGLR